jgi:hypothetical protein
MSVVTSLADAFRRSPVYPFLRRRRQRAEFQRWDREGRLSPPPHLVKQNLVRRYAKQHQCDTLVETGTYRGDMLLAMERTFRQMYSIELQPELHRRAAEMFRGRPHVKLLHGDSGVRIADVLNELDRPALFWLDGHFSAGRTAKGDLNTPISAELDSILSHPVQDHVVLIDDARLFKGTEDYPTVEEIRQQLNAVGPFQLQVEDDVIAITRRAA